MRHLIAFAGVVLLGSVSFVWGEDSPQPPGLELPPPSPVSDVVGSRQCEQGAGVACDWACELGADLARRWAELRPALVCPSGSRDEAVWGARPCPAGACEAQVGREDVSSKVGHLLKAAGHLRAAGLEDEARRLCDRAVREKRQQDERLLARKLAELKRLQAEVQQLRQALAREPRVEIRLKVLEVAREKLSLLGIERAGDGCPDCRKHFVRTVKFAKKCERCSRPADQVVHAGATVIADPASLEKRIAELRESRQLKVLAEPTLVTTSGRPANIACGGEFPIPVPRPDHQVGIEFQEFGFRMQALATILDDGRLRLELAPEFAERDFENAREVDGLVVPGLTVRRINTQVTTTAGETVLIGQLTSGERELLVLVTADLVDELRPIAPAARPPHVAPQPIVAPAPSLRILPKPSR